MYTRKQPWMKEERAEDGALIRAWRLVRRGRVRFGRRTFSHERLAAHEGRYVPVTWSDFWMRRAIVNFSTWDTITLSELPLNDPN